LGVLQCCNPYARGTTYDQPPSSSRTTNSLLALQCYILCVKILARLCEKLLSHPQLTAESEAQAVRQERTLLPSRKTGLVVLTLEERPNNLIDEALCIPLNSGLLLGELHTQLDPLGHSLSCVCGALSAGFKLLRGIEASLGIPKALGVSYESFPVDGADGTGLSNGVEQAAVQTITPSPSLSRRTDDRNRYLDGRLRSDSGITQSLLERLITVLWDEETMLEVSTGSQEAARTVLQRCSKQIYTLAQQHMLFSHSS